MELTHDFVVPAPLEQTWATFMDLERVAGCFPGASVTEVDADSFSGSVKVKLGPIALVYAGAGSFLERDDAAHRAVLEAKGKDKRGNGTAGATVTVQLAASGEGTRVDVTTDLSITGKPAQFGRGVMQDVSDKLLGQFVACIEGQLAAGGAGVGDAAAPSSAGPSAAATTTATNAEPPAHAHPTAPTDPTAATGPPTTEPAPPKAPTAPRPASARPADDALDLGGTVIPVLVRSYLPYGVLTALGVVVGYLIGRRRSR